MTKVCVVVARDRTGRTLDWITRAGQMSKAQLSGALQPVLAKDVLLVSDGNPTYRCFTKDVGISHDPINLSAGLRVNGALHIQNVNAYHGASINGSIAFTAWPLTIWKLFGLVSLP